MRCGIFLSPTFHKCYKEAHGLRLITAGEDAGDCDSYWLACLNLKMKVKHKSKSKAFSKRKIKYSYETIRLMSACTSGYEKKQCQLKIFMSDELNKFGNSHIFIIAQDSNVQVGIREKNNSYEMAEEHIGDYWLDKRDIKETQVMHFVQNKDLRVANALDEN